MSIALAVAGPEGIALATDSRTVQLTGANPEHYRITSERGEKLFLLDDRFGVATYGVAMIGARTIRDLIEDFEIPDGETHHFASSLGEYFYQQLSAVTPAPRRDLPKTIDPGWPLGFLIAGLDDSRIGTLIDVRVRSTGSNVSAAQVSTANPGVLVRGRGDAVNRLIEGVDWRGLEDGGAHLTDQERERLEELRYDLIDPVTLADAVERAKFFVESQISMQSFSDGTLAQPREIPGCGGIVRILTVGRAGASWAENPGSAILSPRSSVAAIGRAGEAG